MVQRSVVGINEPSFQTKYHHLVAMISKFSHPLLLAFILNQSGIYVFFSAVPVPLTMLQ